MPDYDLTALHLVDDEFMGQLMGRLNKLADWEVEGVKRVRKGTKLGPVKARVNPRWEDREESPSDNWKADALCLRVEGDWFDIPSGGVERQRKVKEVELATCQACEVMEECAEAGRTEHDGIWGGLLPRDRGFRPRRRT